MHNSEESPQEGGAGGKIAFEKKKLIEQHLQGLVVALNG